MAVQTIKTLLQLAGVTSAAVPDAVDVMSVTPQNVLTEGFDKNDVVRIGDDGSEERIEFGSSTPEIIVKLQWTYLSDADAGTLMEFWVDPMKGRGKIRTFVWQHPTEGGGTQQYVVRFASNIQRSLNAVGHFGIATISLKIIGWYN